jgi:hypothetical protein
MRNYWIENPNGEYMVPCLMKKEEFFKKKERKISIFGGNSKLHGLIMFVLEKGSDNDWIR